jgi:hypothetical protein
MVNRRPRRRNRPTKVKGLATRNSLRMRKLVVDPHPNEFTFRPWFPLTLRIEPTGLNITLGEVQAALSTQLGTASAFSSFWVRFQEVRCWGSLRAMNAGTSLQPIVIQPNDLFSGFSFASGQEDVLESYSDYPDQVSRARIGYSYSFAQQQVSVFLNQGSTLVLLRTTGMATGSIILIRLLWRSGVQTPAFADPSLHPSVGEED